MDFCYWNSLSSRWCYDMCDGGMDKCNKRNRNGCRLAPVSYQLTNTYDVFSMLFSVITPYLLRL